MESIKKLIFATCFLFFAHSILPCSIVNYECQATNPCVKIQRKGLLFNYNPQYLLLCADAMGVRSPKGGLIPSQCDKKIEGYKGHRMWTNGNYVSWDAQEDVQDGDWIEFTMSPHTSLNDDNTYRDRSDESLSSDKKHIYTPNFTTPALEQFEGFSADTLVNTPFGPREIGNLKKGDTVITRDFSTRVWTKTLVLAVKKTKGLHKLAKIYTPDQIICAGADQTFYSLTDKKWVKAQDLKTGDLLYKQPLENKTLKNSDESILVKEVCLDNRPEHELVSLTLANYYNFSVGNGILAHNSMFAILCTIFNGLAAPAFQELVTNAIVARYSRQRSIEVCQNADFAGRELVCTRALNDPGVFGQQPQAYNYSEEKNNRKDTNKALAVFGCASIGAGVSMTIPGAGIAIGVAAGVGILCYKLAEMFWRSKETSHERIEKSQARWKSTFEGIEELKKRRAEIHSKNLQKASNLMIKNALAQYQLISQQAQELSVKCDQEAWLEQQDRITPTTTRPADLQDDYLTNLIKDKDLAIKSTSLQSELSEDERRNCMENNLDDDKQAALDKEFASMRIKYAPIILAAFEQEIRSGEEALERFRTFADPEAANDMEECITLSQALPKTIPETIKEFTMKIKDFNNSKKVGGFLLQIVNEFLESPPSTILDCVVKATKIIKIGPPITIGALAKISHPAKLLLSGSKPTEFMFPYKKGAGPATIYRAIHDIGDEKIWNIKKGDYFYSDHSHDGDHIEIFHGDDTVNSLGQNISRNAKDVRNWDGSKHEDKKKQALGWEIKIIKGIKEWEFGTRKTPWREIDTLIERQSDNKLGLRNIR